MRQARPAPLRLAFMGTPDFAVPALRALAERHSVIAVYCQPPKPAGRGQHIQKSPVQRAAEEMGLVVHTPKSLRDAEEQRKFAELQFDIAVVAAYGLILPLPILTAPRLGCVNIHASLLPRWRGAAPIQRSILAGDAATGITIMQMDQGLDTGAMLLQEQTPITPATTAGSLHDELMRMGSGMVLRAVEGLAAGTIQPVPQPEAGVTYAAKLTREDGRIDWTQPAATIERQIRALQPWPGCFFMLGDEPVKVLAAEIAQKHGTPGTLLADDFTVACGDGALRLVTLQRGGKKATDGGALLRGLRLPVGHTL